MAAHHGREGAVYTDAETPSTSAQVGEVTGWQYNEEGEELELSALGDTEKRFLTGLVSAGGNFAVYFDDADGEQEALDIGDDVELHLYPRGVGTGLPELTSVGNDASGKVRITSIEYSGDASSAVTRTFNFRNRLLKDTQA